MDRHLVTVFGGSGFIGRHVVRRLAAAGRIVRVVCRDPEAAQFLKPYGDAGQIVPVAGDVADAAAARAHAEGAETVINLVGILYERGRRTFQRVHVEGAANAARAAAEAGAGRFVQMSAIGADPASDAAYARTKAGGEVAARAAFPGVTVLRPSVVFGPEDDFFNRFAMMARVMPALPVFPTRFQPVYVGDVADAVMAVLADPETAGRTYELGGPRVMDFREVMKLLLDVIERQRMLISVPLAVASLQASLLELMSPPPLTRDQVRLLATDNVCAPGVPGLADLGIEPTAAEAIVPGYLRRHRPQARQRDRAARDG